MAKLIRKGVTPVFGLEDEAGILIQSFSADSQAESVETRDGRGNICGHILYNETIGFSMDFQIVYDGTSDADSIKTNAAKYLVGEAVALTNEPIARALINPNFLDDEVTVETAPLTCIVTGASLNTSAGAAATISATGSFYLYDKDKTTLVDSQG